MAPKSPKSQQKTKTKAGKFLSGIANTAKTIIKKVGAGSQTASLQATTLPGAGKVFTGNTPNQQAKSAREQAIIAPKGKRTVSFGKPKGAPLPAGTTRGNLVNQSISSGGQSSNSSGNVPMRNDAQRNNSYGDPIAEGFGGINTASNESQGTSVNGRQTVGTPTTPVVNAQDIAGTKRPDLAGTNPDDYLIDYSSTIPGLQQQTDLQKAESESESITDKWLKNMSQTPDIAGIESKIRNQLGIEQKQQEVNSLQGQLNAIVAQGQQNQLRVVGQGRGIPEAILGGQQAQFARETAIASLPVSAQLEAAQGNLEMANESLDRLFKIYSDQAQNEYNAKNRMFEVMSSISDKKVQRLFEEKKIENERAYQEKRDLYKEQNDYAKMALSNGQASLSAKISKLDYKSATFKDDLAKLQSQLRDPVQKAQLEKLNMEIAALAGQQEGSNDDLMAYASRYAESGTLPNPSELKLSGLSVGQVTLFAKQIPKTKGAVVAIQTGTKPTNVSAEAEKDFQKLYNITEMTKRLKELDKKRVGGIISGVTGKVFGSEDQGEYLTLRKAIVDEMSRMQSGAALTPEEIAVYNDYLPGRYSESFGLGRDSYKKITSFETAMNQKLNNRLANNGLSIYGYSTLKVPGDTAPYRTVGEIIDVKGVNYRVLPDGTLTDIL